MRFGAVSLTAIVLLAAIFSALYGGAADRRAVWVSAGVAVAIQLAAFGVVLANSKQSVIVGWGVGVGVRFAAFVLWGFAGVSQLGLPQGAALMSMASFLFVTTVIEPLFLKT